jgi:hypothetical protein
MDSRLRGNDRVAEIRVIRFFSNLDQAQVNIVRALCALPADTPLRLGMPLAQLQSAIAS